MGADETPEMREAILKRRLDDMERELSFTRRELDDSRAENHALTVC